MAAPAGGASLWRHRDFMLLWAGQTISQFGSQVVILGLSFVAILTLDAGSAELGFLNAASRLPFFLVSLFAGVLVDRLRRRRVLIVSDVSRAALLAVIPMAAVGGVLGLEVLYLIAFLVGVFTVLFEIAYHSYVPTLVSGPALADANGKLESTRSAAQIVGPGLAGGLISLLTAPISLVAGCITYALSAMFVKRIRTPEPEPAEKPQGSVLAQIRAGFAVVAGHVVLRVAVITAGIFNLAFGAFQAIFMLFLTRELGMSPAQIGVVVASAGPGLLIGSLIGSHVSKRLGLGLTVAGAALVSDVALLAIPLLATGSGLGTMTTVVVANFLFGLGAQIYNINLLALRQSITPMEVMGRVNATIRFVALSMAPLGAVTGGLLGETLGMRPALVVAAAGMLLAFVTVLLSPIVRMKAIPLPDASGP